MSEIMITETNTRRISVLHVYMEEGFKIEHATVFDVCKIIV